MKPAKAKIISIAYSWEISVQCTDDKKMFIVRVLHHQPTSTYRGIFCGFTALCTQSFVCTQYSHVLIISSLHFFANDVCE